MKPFAFVRMAVLASLALLPLGTALAAAPNRTDVTSSAKRLKPLSAKLEALDWYSKDEPINLRFSLTNPNPVSVWVLRCQLPSEEIDAHIFDIRRDGQPVHYRGPLVKRAAPESEDYLEIEGGQTFSLVFDPTSVYEVGPQGNYTIAFRGKKLDIRTQPPEVRQEVPTLMLRNPEAFAARKLDTLPGQKVEVEGVPSVTLWYEGQIPTFKGPDVQTVIGGYTRCTTAQQGHIQTALSNAIMLSNKAITHLSTNPNGSSHYVTYFGAYTSSRFNLVGNHFNAINDVFRNKTMTFNCASKKSYYAYVYPDQPYKIYFGKAMWTAPALGQDSKAGVLIHETSHFNVVAGTDDYVYGASGARSLAITNPSQAVMNADNHEYFAELMP